MRRTDPRARRSWLTLLASWVDRARGRRLLAGLDDAALKDLGLSRVDAWQEARKAVLARLSGRKGGSTMLTPEELQHLCAEARRERSLAIAAMLTFAWRRLRQAVRRVAKRRPERLAPPRACG